MEGGPARNREAVDLTLLYKRLYVAAARLVGADGRSICGVSAEDLVQTALAEFWRSPNALSWDGADEGLVRLLCKVVARRYVDAVRRGKKASKEDPDSALANLVSESVGTNDDRIAGEWLQSLLFEKVQGHPKERELRDFITAAGMISHDSLIDQQMAALLGPGVDVDEVRNRRRMLRRMISIEDVRALTAGRAK